MKLFPQKEPALTKPVLSWTQASRKSESPDSLGVHFRLTACTKRSKQPQRAVWPVGAGSRAGAEPVRVGIRSSSAESRIADLPFVTQIVPCSLQETSSPQLESERRRHLSWFLTDILGQHVQDEGKPHQWQRHAHPVVKQLGMLKMGYARRYLVSSMSQGDGAEAWRMRVTKPHQTFWASWVLSCVLSVTRRRGTNSMMAH